MWKGLMRCILGPNILRIHHDLPMSDVGHNYVPSPLEHRTQKVFDLISYTKNILYYTAPVWTIMLYKRGCFTVAFGAEFFKYSVWFAVFYFGLMFVRGLGRAGNQEYLDFISMLDSGQPEKKRTYDFEFSHWPVDFTWIDKDAERHIPINAPPYHITGRLKKILEDSSIARLLIQGLPCELLSYAVSHGFGLSMVYPGSTAPLNALIRSALQDGRNKLIENHRGRRAKLRTRDGNDIDTVFIARTSDEDDPVLVATRNGQTLVIGCEGNAGFYEIGVMSVPLDAGYSVLGWNHPGFGSSTGTPSPAGEIYAIDVVMQYAIGMLGFEPKNIIVMGWSIGAFPAIHAARMYPDIKAIFLDATFDDIMPLALRSMPPSLEFIVKRTIRGYINLHHSEIIKSYSGPVHFVRRQMDEIMNIDGQRVVTSNCGNSLLYKFLVHRFPHLFGSSEEDKLRIKTALDSWLDRDDDLMRSTVLSNYEVSDRTCEALLSSYVEKQSVDYPILIGEDWSVEAKQKMVLYLASKHMNHFESSHCTPLPASMFGKPWDIRDIKDGCESDESSQCSISDFEIVNGNNKL